MDDIGVFGIVAQAVDRREADGSSEAAALPVGARRPEHVGEVALILRHDLIRQELRNERAIRADFCRNSVTMRRYQPLADSRYRRNSCRP